ncbi:MAG: glycosyltransferase family 4 protein [Lyngbya sp.]|nr:glycosyltransferase family 4 protein [Lyngbya sp.]
MMKVLHINQSDLAGGAAIAGYRLHQGLLTQNVESRLIVKTVKTTDSRVTTIPQRQRLFANQLFRITTYLGLNYVHVRNTFEIPDHPFYKEADILNLHSLHTGYFNYLAIPLLTRKKPAIITLHDMWDFTGHCAYSYDCDRWKTGCGQCPYPEIYPAIRRDNTRLEWRLKNWVYHHSDLTVVAPSYWLTEQAKQSMLNCCSIHHIPYGINTDTYQPLDQEKCRLKLSIPTEKKVIMFGAESLKDPRKGGDLLIKALSKLPASIKAETILLTFGKESDALSETVGMQTINLGYISDDYLKSVAYCAADLFIFPTRADNLPLVLQESMACGTPMVSFKIGGVPDLVRPGITGYLATPEDAGDFCRGIVQLLEDDNLRQKMSQQCREIAITEYPLEQQAQRYIELYQQVLENWCVSKSTEKSRKKNAISQYLYGFSKFR